MLDALFQNEAWFQDVQYQLASAKLMKALRIVRLGRAYPELVPESGRLRPGAAAS